jgi:hypothetical protein
MNYVIRIIGNNNTSQIIRKKYTATTKGRQKFVASLRQDDVVAIKTDNSSFILAKLIQKYVHCKIYVLNADELHIIFRSLKKTEKEDGVPRRPPFLWVKVPQWQLPVQPSSGVCM